MTFSGERMRDGSRMLDGDGRLSERATEEAYPLSLFVYHQYNLCAYNRFSLFLTSLRCCHGFAF